MDKANTQQKVLAVKSLLFVPDIRFVKHYLNFKILIMFVHTISDPDIC